MSKAYFVECSACNGTGKLQVNWLGYRRKELGLTQAQLASILGVQRTQVSNIERGYSALTSDKILVWANNLQVSADELLQHLHGEATPSTNPQP